MDPSRTKPIDESTLWSAFCNAWIFLHKFVRPAQPENWEAKNSIPMWVPHLVHKKRAKIQCK